jgi:hypothetical protein
MVAGASGGLSGSGEDECEGERLVAEGTTAGSCVPPPTLVVGKVQVARDVPVVDHGTKPGPGARVLP